MTRIATLCYRLALSAALIFHVLGSASAAQMAHDVPTYASEVTFEQLGKATNLDLEAVHTTEQIDFTLRRDRIATSATLNLLYTPSPSLIPAVSHLRIFLNDELMAVLPITAEQAGKQVSQHIVLDPRRIIDFNRIRLDLIGHYSKTNEELAYSSVWLNISRQSSIALEQQALAIRNDLSYFPAPFFDPGSRTPLQLPFVFADSPSAGKQRAAAILASYFGSKASWRGARFPVTFNTLPDQNCIVFATNDKLPDFLAGYPRVQGPVVDMISHPFKPYLKLLVILGRNDEDLVRAATALALGNALFRGNSVTINDVQTLRPRLPYDAPNWIRADRPVRFSELIDFPGQLQANGLRPNSIGLTLHLPPDLFIWQNTGVPMVLKYRHTLPPFSDESRLNVAVNSRFVASYPLNWADSQIETDKIHLPLRSDSLFEADKDLSLPALRPGITNTLTFDFAYTTVGSFSSERHHISLLPDVRATIDDDSTLDLSGFRHYISLPDLQVFANTGFPFSRMADLSETIVVMPEKAEPASLSTLLDFLGRIGADTGYPGTGVRITTDWDQASKADADLLLVGPMPESLRRRPDSNLMLDTVHGWAKQPRSRSELSVRFGVGAPDVAATQAGTQVSVTSAAPIAAIVGMQSPSHDQRSVISLLASTAEDYGLLRDAIADTGKRAAMGGSVVIVRDSGIYSQQVGPSYSVGYLPWWTHIWYRLYSHPILLAVASGLVAMMAALLLWSSMRRISRKRLSRVHDSNSRPADQ